MNVDRDSGRIGMTDVILPVTPPSEPPMRNLSRRQFLQGSAAAGASLLIMGTRASGNIKGANDRVRIAVAGLHGRGNAHIKGWLEQDNVEIVAVIDPDRRRPRPAPDLDRKAVERQIEAQGLHRRPQGAGRSHARRDFGRHAQPLAFADHDLGRPGGQKCLRRKADEPRRRSKAAWLSKPRRNTAS